MLTMVTHLQHLAGSDHILPSSITFGRGQLAQLHHQVGLAIFTSYLTMLEVILSPNYIIILAFVIPSHVTSLAVVIMLSSVIRLDMVVLLSFCIRLALDILSSCITKLDMVRFGFTRRIHYIILTYF